MKDRCSIGVALSGGSARGLAHLGVMRVLDEAGIPVDMIAGTSMGAIVAAIYATGGDMRLTARLVQNMDEKNFFDLTLRKQGLIKGARFQAVICTLTKDMDFDQTRIPLAVVACDLLTGEKVVYREGKIHEAVRGSISLPMFFAPHRYDGRILIDGGVVDRMPADVVRMEMGADIVIAVDVGHRGQPQPEPENRREVVLRTLDIMSWEIAKCQEQYYDFLITPGVKHIPSLSLSKAKECIELGKKAAEEALPALKRLIEEKNAEKRAATSA
jgi:NTE family protein